MRLDDYKLTPPTKSVKPVKTLADINPGDVFKWTIAGGRNPGYLAMRVVASGGNKLTCTEDPYRGNKYFWIYLTGSHAGRVFSDAGKEEITELQE